MTRTFIYTTVFRNSWDKMGLNDADLRELEEQLLKNPKAGDVIEGTGGARKIRIQLENRGKSGGGRVIYVDIFEKEHLHMLLAYPKKVQDDLTSEQKRVVKRLVEQIKKE